MRVTPYIANMATHAAARNHIDRRNATPIRRSSASTYSPALSSTRGGVARSFIVRLRGHLDTQLQNRAHLRQISSLALQVIDHDRLGSVVGGGVLHSVQRDRRITSIVIRLIAFIESALLRRALFFAEIRVNECEIVMGRQV